MHVCSIYISFPIICGNEFTVAHVEQVQIYMDFVLNISDLFFKQFSVSCDSNTTLHHTGVCSVQLSLSTSRDAKENEAARMTEGSLAFAAVKKGWFYCHKTLQSQTLEIIGDVRLLYIVPHTMSSQPALRIKDYSRQESWESSGLLWRNRRRVTGRYKVHGHLSHNSWQVITKRCLYTWRKLPFVLKQLKNI